MKVELIKRLNSIDNVLFAYLYGSYARSEQNQNSDIDIAVYLKNISLDSQLEVNYQLSKLLKKDVDLTLLNTTKNLFLLENIFKDGIVLKDHESRFDFELVMQHDILDYKAFRKYIDAA